MIEPHLATMLAFVLTDVDLPRWVDGLVNIYREV
jgi:N-acetylglutamate synthase/N-acetylornithine aminotransferase